MLVMVGDGCGALAGEGGGDEVVLVVGGRDVVPRVLGPDVGIVGEQPAGGRASGRAVSAGDREEERRGGRTWSQREGRVQRGRGRRRRT